MNTKYIFIDFDRTLYDHDTNTIYAKDIQAIKQATENGHLVFLCTGRPNVNLTNALNCNIFAGEILSCGAYIKLNNKPIYCKTLPTNDVINFVKDMINSQIDFSLDGVHKSFLSPYAYEIFKKRMLFDSPETLGFGRHQTETLYKLKDIKTCDLDQILKISLYAKDFKKCEKFISLLPSTYRSMLHINNKDHFVGGEIALASINKATGIQRVINYFNASIEDTIGIGDSMNDYEMIQTVNLGICMGNGKKEIKQIADYVTLPISENGIAHALKHFQII